MPSSRRSRPPWWSPTSAAVAAPAIKVHPALRKTWDSQPGEDPVRWLHGAGKGVICQDAPRLSVAPSPGGQLSGAGGERRRPGALSSCICSGCRLQGQVPWPEAKTMGLRGQKSRFLERFTESRRPPERSPSQHLTPASVSCDGHLWPPLPRLPALSVYLASHVQAPAQSRGGQQPPARPSLHTASQQSPLGGELFALILGIWCVCSIASLSSRPSLLLRLGYEDPRPD